MPAEQQGGLMAAPRRVDDESWVCDANPAHGQASVKLTPRYALCGACASRIEDALLECRGAEAWAALTGVQP
jgi:hypothetical protein